MKTEIVEVITKILEGIGTNTPLEDVNKKLLKSKEYDEQTLSIAFSLIYDKILLTGKNKLRVKEKSIRILTEEEKYILGTDNYNYIMHLYNLRLLNSESLESMLEQVIMFPENRITRKEINWIVLISIVDFDNEIPSGSRYLLYSSDSVN
ncbi:MAG: DUF494 family protein [Ignavibacteriales bacterium]|nr:DUF494 family protein [Ignavibacteriales bacterium]